MERTIDYESKYEEWKNVTYRRTKKENLLCGV